MRWSVGCVQARHRERKKVCVCVYGGQGVSGECREMRLKELWVVVRYNTSALLTALVLMLLVLWQFHLLACSRVRVLVVIRKASSVQED